MFGTFYVTDWINLTCCGPQHARQDLKHRIEITQKANSRIFNGHALKRGPDLKTSLSKPENIFRVRRSTKTVSIAFHRIVRMAENIGKRPKKRYHCAAINCSNNNLRNPELSFFRFPSNSDR